MKKFQFRLATVERHRKLKEQEQQLYLARSLEKMKTTEKKLLDIDKREVQARREFARLGDPIKSEPITTSNFWLLDRFIEGQKVRRTNLKKQLIEDEEQVKFRYKEFLKARQQKMIMEKLREKKQKIHREELLKQERIAQDEHYVTRSARRYGNKENESDD